MTARFQLGFRLTVTEAPVDTLAEALAPETDPEHAKIAVEDDTLAITGAGDAGRCLHTLDDVLACLTAAVDALDVE